MRKQSREKGIYHAVRQYDDCRKKSIDNLIKIVTDLLPPCEVTFEDDTIYILFPEHISADSITYALGINDSYINIITALTGRRNHFAIPLDFIRR